MRVTTKEEPSVLAALGVARAFVAEVIVIAVDVKALRVPDAVELTAWTSVKVMAAVGVSAANEQLPLQSSGRSTIHSAEDCAGGGVPLATLVAKVHPAVLLIRLRVQI